MSEELKSCPFCNGKLTYFGRDLNRRVNPPAVIDVYKHFYADENDTSKDCCLSQLIFDASRWQARPIEDAIRAELAQVRAERDALKAALHDAKRERAQYGDKMSGIVIDLEIERDALKVVMRDVITMCDNTVLPAEYPEVIRQTKKFLRRALEALEVK